MWILSSAASLVWAILQKCRSGPALSSLLHSSPPPLINTQVQVAGGGAHPRGGVAQVYTYTPPLPLRRSKSQGEGTPEVFHKQAVADLKQWSSCLEAAGKDEHKCLQQYTPQVRTSSGCSSLSAMPRGTASGGPRPSIGFRVYMGPSLWFACPHSCRRHSLSLNLLSLSSTLLPQCSFGCSRTVRSCCPLPFPPPSVLSPPTPLVPSQQLVKGMYAAFLPAWLEVWPRDRLMLLRTEDYKAETEAHVAAAARFLGEGAGGLGERVRVTG